MTPVIEAEAVTAPLTSPTMSDPTWTGEVDADAVIVPPTATDIAARATNPFRENIKKKVLQTRRKNEFDWLVDGWDEICSDELDVSPKRALPLGVLPIR